MEVMVVVIRGVTCTPLPSSGRRRAMPASAMEVAVASKRRML